MYYGDRSRKEALVEYGFRLPSAFDNRPLTFEEFTRLVKQTVYVSATPSDYEMRLADDAVAEQVIRPTGLTDPRSPCGRRAIRWTTCCTRSERAPIARSGCWSRRSPSGWRKT